MRLTKHELEARVRELEAEKKRILNLINVWASANTDSESKELAESKLIDEVIDMPNIYAGEGEKVTESVKNTTKLEADNGGIVITSDDYKLLTRMIDAIKAADQAELAKIKKELDNE